MSRKKILLLAVATILLMGGVSVIGLILVGKTPLPELLQGKFSFWIQGIAGISYGLITAAMAWKIVEWPQLATTKSFFEGIFEDTDLSILDIVFISLCAGVGEELLFRGLIQPYLGIWITSFIFVAVHGYLNPLNRPLMTYGLSMVVIIAGVGALTQWVGIVSSMIAHTVIDIYLLMKLARRST